MDEGTTEMSETERAALVEQMRQLKSDIQRLMEFAQACLDALDIETQVVELDGG